MRRCNKIDIMAPLLLEMNHDAGQFLRRYGDALTAMADIVVLTENAVEIAVGEENRSRSPPPHQWFLFSKVRPIARHHCLAPGATISHFSLEAVHFAEPRAEGTSLQPAQAPADLFFQPAGTVCLKISRRHERLLKSDKASFERMVTSISP